MDMKLTCLKAEIINTDRAAVYIKERERKEERERAQDTHLSCVYNIRLPLSLLAAAEGKCLRVSPVLNVTLPEKRGETPLDDLFMPQ